MLLSMAPFPATCTCVLPLSAQVCPHSYLAVHRLLYTLLCLILQDYFTERDSAPFRTLMAAVRASGWLLGT